MGYWSTIPMGGDLPLDIKDKVEDILVILIGDDKVRKAFDDYYDTCENPTSDESIELYEDKVEEFKIFIQKFSNESETTLINVLKNTKEDNKKEENDYNFVIPLSFLEWEVKLNYNSDLSKYLLELLKDTDGGNKDRGYEDKENMYPNKLYTPYDFIKYYIDNWDKLITRQIDYGKITSNVDVPTLGENLINVK